MSASRMVPRVLLVLGGLWLASGCGPPVNPERLREEILKVDPGFSGTLQKHDELADRIAQFDHELELKRAKVEQKIAELRKDLQETEKQVAEKIQKTKALIKPEDQRLDLAIAQAVDERKVKRTQRSVVGGSISRLRKSLKQTAPEWGEADRVRMQTELDELLKETQRLDQEVTDLNEHIRLLKVKKILLRL